MKHLFENWNKFLNEVDRSASDILQSWEHKDAANYAQELIDDYGEPDVATDNMLLWKAGISEFIQTYVKDESIPHDSPKPHKDFVYSTMEIDIPEDLMEAVAKASESIIVDQLKNEVTARCGDIYANAITLGFVQKLVAGEISPEDATEEYKEHILGRMLPDWFEEKVEEGKKKKSDPCWKGYEMIGMKEKGGKEVPNCVPLEEQALEEAEPAKGKRFAKKVKGKGGRTRTVSYGQAGKAKDGGDRIRPGTAKGDAYCARSAKIKKCKNPPCANDLSRKKWKCQGSKSVAEMVNRIVQEEIAAINTKAKGKKDKNEN